jgi:hypothetical protein
MTCAVLTAVVLTALPADALSGSAVVRLNVRAMPAPKPALKYQLLPEVRELKPGNPAQDYLKCFAEQRNFFFSKEAVAQRTKYLTMPLADLPSQELREYGRNALWQADWAARLDTVDWAAAQRVQAEGLDVAVPEVAPLRILATALRVRVRGQVAGRHFDDAVRTAKTMFALARHLGEHPTLAANLVGLSTAQSALDTLEEMVQQPGCPNLYWALTDLPCPLVELRKGAQGERALVAADLRPIRDDAPMTDAQVEQLVSRLSGVLGVMRVQTGQPPRSLRAALEARVKDADRVRAARGRLVEAGCAESLVKTFPPAQVILLDEKRDYELRRDEALKLLALAPWQIDALTGGEAAQDGDGLLADLLPHIIEVRRAQGRLEQRIGLLRHVEALRLYAAGHDGPLPSKLSDLPVPVPADPFTGKPFDYRAEGTTARLGGSPPRGEEQNPRYNVRYEVTVQK